MYAVVQIGSRIFRSPMVMNRSVPPRFGVWARAGVASVAAAAAVEARNWRRVRSLMGRLLGSAREIGGERRKRRGRELVRRQPLPVPFGHVAPEPLGLRLRLGQERYLVHAHDAAALDDGLAVHDDLVDIVPGPALHEGLDRIAVGSDAQAPHVDQYDVGFRPGREAAEVVARERPGAAEGGGREDLGGGGGGEVALDDLAEIRGPAHLADEVSRVGVGAEADVDAGPAELRERLQRVAAPGEDEQAVRDGGAGAGQDLEVAPPRQGGQVVGGADDAVPDDRSGREEAGVGQVLHRRHRVAAQDLVELEEVLARVDLDPDAELVGSLAGGAEEPRAAGVDLVREEHALDTTAVVAGVRSNERLGALEASQARLFVDVVVELALGGEAVVVRLVGGGEIGTQAQLTGDARVLLGRHPDLHDGGAAVSEQLGQREPTADLGVLPGSERLDALPRGEVVEEAGVKVVPPADVGDQAPARLHVGVTVDVDQTGDHELA